MSTVIVDDVQLVIPEWVGDIESFRRWTDEPTFPEHGNIWWLRGGVWADMSKEQVFTHNLVRTRITSALDRLADEEDLGLVLSDGVLLTNFAADISGNPDLTFISHEAREAERVRLVEGKREGYTEVQGSPDMVLEVLSTGSVHKDTEVLREAYWQAGVTEYWIVDAREAPPRLDILRRTSRGFSPRKKQEGWVKSAVFNKSFRLVQEADRFGDPRYHLEIR